MVGLLAAGERKYISHYLYITPENDCLCPIETRLLGILLVELTDLNPYSWRYCKHKTSVFVCVNMKY